MPFSGFQAAAFEQSQLYVNHLKIFSRFRVASTVGERVGGNGCNRGAGTVVLTEKKKRLNLEVYNYVLFGGQN